MDPARASAVELLVELETTPRTVRDALAAAGSAAGDPRDRALAREIVLGVVRRRATLDHLLAGVSATPLRRLDPVVRAALRSALAQLLLLDRVPAHAAVDGAVEIVKARTSPRLAGFVNGVLRTIVRGIEGTASEPEDARRDVPRPDGSATRLRGAAFPDPALEPDANLALRFAHPAWLVARWRARFDAATLRAALQGGISRPPPAETGADAPTGPERVADLLDARAGARVLVVGGGRRGAGALLVERFGVGAVAVADGGSSAPPLGGRAPDGVRLERAAGHPSDLSRLPPGAFDAVLVEAESTSTGILRRRPEAADRLEERDVLAHAARARTLLRLVVPLVRGGGRVVLATRSIEPEEGPALVADVARESGAGTEAGFDVLPAPAHDGGYAGVLRPV